MRRLIRRLFNWATEDVYEQGWQDGLGMGIKAARVLLYEDLKRIGSTGDNLEVPWSMVDSLLKSKED
jgi:hypothetical protein